MRNRWLGAVLLCGAFGCSSNATTTNDAGGTGGGSEGGTTALTPCLQDAGAHFVVDPKDGKCKLDGTTTNVGAACMGLTPTICGTDQNASCLDPAIDDFPGGYCNVDPCSELAGHMCPVGASCVQLNGENPQCFKDCASDSDCRNAEGYFCLDMTGDPLWNSGASHKVCSRAQLICPGSNQDCPVAVPRCVLPDGGVAWPDGGTSGVDAGSGGDGSAGAAVDGAAVAPPTPICTK